MSIRGQIFADDWVAQHIGPEDIAPVDDLSLAEDRAEALIAAAQAMGITRQEMEDEVGPLADFIAEAMEIAADNEVARLAGKGT